jgi:hypothetical protein
LVIVGILVLGGGGFGIWQLTKGNDKGTGGGPANPSDPQAVAQRFADIYGTAVNTDLWGFNPDDFRPVMCGKDYDRNKQDTEHTAKTRESARRKPTKKPESDIVDTGVKDVNVEGDHGTFKLTQLGHDGKKIKDRPLQLQRSGGNWQVCGLFADDQRRPSATVRVPTSR